MLHHTEAEAACATGRSDGPLSTARRRWWGLWLNADDVRLPEGTCEGLVYQLLVCVRRPVVVRVGRLGTVRFEAGYYVYTGSARRAAGARIRRHLGHRKTRRWHIDYLLEAAGVRVLAVRLWRWRPGGECERNMRLVRRGLGTPAVRGFGNGDCRYGCPAHLVRLTDRGERALVNSLLPAAAGDKAGPRACRIMATQEVSGKGLSAS